MESSLTNTRLISHQVCSLFPPAQALWIIEFEFELLGMYKDPLWIKYEP